MLKKTYPYYLANQPQTSKAMMDVLDKYRESHQSRGQGGRSHERFSPVGTASRVATLRQPL